MTDRPVTTRDMTGPLRDLLTAAVVDVSNCHRHELLIGLNEFEKAGVRFETWPDEVRRLVEDMIADWQKKHPERALVLFSTGVVVNEQGRFCFAILHHGGKG